MIFAWNAVHVKGTARTEQFSWMWEMDADVLRELFKVPLMEQHPLVAVPMKLHAVINTKK
jgi:hypothetical protein